MTQTDPAQLLSGQDVYDAIMRAIEPELVSDMLPQLDALYAGKETPEQKTERLKRYEAAFARYDQEFGSFLQTLHAEVHAVKREARQTAEGSDKAQDAAHEEEILTQMKNA